MSAAEIALLVLAVLALVAVVLWSVAQRLDRLHRREFQTRAALEAQLVRRADIAAEVAASGILDPASAVLVSDAVLSSMRAVRLVGEDDTPQAHADRGLIESELTRTLRTALDETDPAIPARDTAAAEAVERLRHSHYRVQLARRFHNDAVVQIHHIRRLALVRLFRLAGHAPLPRTFEMDDAPV